MTLHRFDDDKAVDLTPINNDVSSVIGADAVPEIVTNGTKPAPTPAAH